MKKFEPKVWVDDIDLRYRMANDLMENDMLIGKSKDEVIALLGEEDEVVSGYDNALHYLMPDPEIFSMLDFSVFYIGFDENNKVIDAYPHVR